MSKIKENYSFNGNGRVLKGINNWLFYKGDNSLDNFQNKTLLSNEELKSIAKYLSDIDNWCKKNNKSFYYVVAPDKNKIYGENISILKKIHPDSESRANQLINYLNKNTKVNVVYPYDILIKNKDNGLLYYKHDTHWNDYGAYFGYNEIMKKIMTKYKRIIPIKYEKLSEVYHETGDLDTMIDSCIKDKSLYFIPEIKDNSVCKFNSEDKDERKGLECKNRKNNLSVFVFRDSFTIALKRYYNNTFNTVKYEWRYNVTSEDLKNIKDNFDIIILENVERNIPSLINLQFPKD